jgi:hypothetical protein
MSDTNDNLICFGESVQQYKGFTGFKTPKRSNCTGKAPHAGPHRVTRPRIASRESVSRHVEVGLITPRGFSRGEPASDHEPRHVSASARQPAQASNISLCTSAFHHVLLYPRSVGSAVHQEGEHPARVSAP